MSLFNRNFKNNSSEGTTKGFYIGSAEAEAENQKGALNHLNYFEDYLEILPEVEKGKFIITGRKGAGKSAIARYIKEKADSSDNCYAELIRLNEIDVEKLKQFDQNDEFEHKDRIIIEWIILVRLISLIVKNEAAKYIAEYGPLKHFLEKNAGLVKIDQYQVAEIVTTKKFEVSFETLARVFKPIFGKYFNIKTVRAPFYRLITPLKEVVQTILQYQVNKDLDFVLLFDDLDVNLKAYNEHDVNRITELIRVAKNYNNEVFKNTNTRIIVLMRDDIKKMIDSHHSDTAKIFSSYEIFLNWYNHESFKQHENFTQLKKFINKRIKINFEVKNVKYNKVDPWSSLIENENVFYADKTAFKYILDHTFYRPRDLILFFNPIGQYEYSFPLEPKDVKALLRQFFPECIREIKNELSLLMKPPEINELMNILREISIPQVVTFQQITAAISKYNCNKSTESIIQLFCSYSLLGLKDKSNSRIYFSHRENFDLNSVNLGNYDYVVHQIPLQFYYY